MNFGNRLSSPVVTLDDITLASSITVRNLEYIFDQDLSFKSNIKQIFRTTFFNHCNIVKTQKILSHSDAEKLINFNRGYLSIIDIDM